MVALPTFIRQPFPSLNSLEHVEPLPRLDNPHCVDRMSLVAVVNVNVRSIYRMKRQLATSVSLNTAGRGGS